MTYAWRCHTCSTEHEGPEAPLCCGQPAARAYTAPHLGRPRRPRSVVAGGSKHVEVIHESTGRTGGHHTHHGDGRVDATVNHATTTVNPFLKARRAL